MEFQGPSATDYDNVSALNRAFLAMLRRDPAARLCLRRLSRELAPRLLALSGSQAARLATAPFLLMSLRERDERFWDRIFSAETNHDLFAVPPPGSDELARLIAAGLGFVWQLARQNPYAARLICGASLHWCEQLTERTFFRILTAVGTQSEVLVLRSAANAGFWTKLLHSGISREKRVLHAAHIGALQSILTRPPMPTGTRWATAACSVQSPSLRVADHREN